MRQEKQEGEDGRRRVYRVREIKPEVSRVLSQEPLGVCAVCLNDDSADEGNMIIICDTCGIAVHQARPKYFRLPL